MKWMRYRFFYFALSGLMIIVAVFSLLKWGLKLGVDFKGGALLEYRFGQEISTEEATRLIEAEGIEVSSVQRTQEAYLFRLSPIGKEEEALVESILQRLSANQAEELRFETVGPSIGPELIKKTLYAAGIAAFLILLLVAYQFKNFKFGVSAVLAMLHDSFLLVGAFSLLGHFFGTEIDFLFVTALLTTLSFSVHDTIVVFDRIRESPEGEDFSSVADKALTETMVRSLNNSFTIIFMLVALIIIGGTTIKWFAVALLVGTVLGTYSSPFVAVPLLATLKRKSR